VSNSWIVVIGTLGGVLLTATAGIVTAYLSGRQRITEAKYQAAVEQNRQVRNERRDIYVDYFSTYRTMYSRAHALAADGGRADQVHVNTARGPLWVFENIATEEVLDFSRSFYALSICASEATREAADEATSTLWKLAGACVMGDQAAVEEADSETHEPRRRLRAAMLADLSES
jgi:hypothetical protein